MNKLNSKSVTEVVAYTSGATIGGMTSRVLVDKLPFLKENSKAKRGIVLALSVVAGALADGKTNGGKLLQGAAFGAAAVQLNDLIKDIAKPAENGILKTALGNPETPIILTYDGGMEDTMLDYPYNEPSGFLAAAEENIFAAS